MANTAQAGYGTPLPCVDCNDRGTALWISHDAGANWFQIPMISQVQKQASRQNAQTIRFEGQSVNVCTSASKTWTYLATSWFCLSLHIRNFLHDGDQVWGRIVFGNQLGTDPEEIANLTYDDDGWTRNDQATTPTQVVHRLEASTILYNNFANVAGTPRDPDSTAAEITAAGVTL